MKGRLQDMAVADLIQHTCQDRKTARVQLRSGRQRADLYFKNGNVVHATLGKHTGEEAVYELMNWDEGDFELSTDVDPPTVSITRSWTSLLLEAARLSDEGTQVDTNPVSNGTHASEPAFRGRDERFLDIVQDFALGTPQQVIEQLSHKIDGHHFSCATRIRGGVLYWFASIDLAAEEWMEELNQFAKLVSTSAKRLNSLETRETTLITDKEFLLLTFLGREDFYFVIAADKGRSDLGALRHLARVYAEKLRTALKLAGDL